jgi:hypothetical protein
MGWEQMKSTFIKFAMIIVAFCCMILALKSTFDRDWQVSSSWWNACSFLLWIVVAIAHSKTTTPPTLSAKPKVMKLIGITLKGCVVHESYRLTQNDTPPQTKLPHTIEANTTGQEPEVFCTIIMPEK